ncbi:MAG: methyltransferase domain-containing protein [Nitrospira sp.]|nr:methyltransferase domain-containing protein [Nitrospira sp.]
MPERSAVHHSTTKAVAQTLLTYEKDAKIFLQQWGRKKYKRPALLKEWMALVPEQGVLLDLGCGAGQDARYLATIGHRVIGVDRTMPLLQFAKRRSSSIPLVLADMRALPLRDGTLDGIWAAASLIHLPKKTASTVLALLQQLVSPEGLLAGTFTFGSNSRVKTGGWMPGRFFARWKKDELARTFRRAGWRVLSIRVVNNQERKGRWVNVIARRI